MQDDHWGPLAGCIWAEHSERSVAAVDFSVRKLRGPYTKLLEHYRVL